MPTANNLEQSLLRTLQYTFTVNTIVAVELPTVHNLGLRLLWTLKYTCTEHTIITSRVLDYIFLQTLQEVLSNFHSIPTLINWQDFLDLQHLSCVRGRAVWRHQGPSASPAAAVVCPPFWVSERCLYELWAWHTRGPHEWTCKTDEEHPHVETTDAQQHTLYSKQHKNHSQCKDNE